MMTLMNTLMMTKFFAVKSQKGATMIEYALIAALISVGAIGALQLIGTDVAAAFQSVADALPTAAPPEDPQG